MRHAPAIIAALTLAAAVSGQTAVLWDGNPPPSGVTLREEMRIRLEKGDFSLGVKDQALRGAANAAVHDIIERSYPTPTEQKIEVLASARNIRFSFGGSSGGGNSEPKDTVGHLLGKKLTGKKTDSRWVFSLAGKEAPDSAESSALKQFTGYAEAVEALGLLYGTIPRKVGETWKPDLGAPAKTGPDIQTNLECKLEEIGPEQDDTIARLSVTGRLTANLGSGNSVQIAINAVVRRSLRDMVDLNTEVNGNFRYTGKFGKGDSQARITAPVKLTRTVKVVKR